MKKTLFAALILISFLITPCAYGAGYTKVLHINASEEDIKNEQLRHEEEIKNLEIEKLKEENKKLQAEIEKLKKQIEIYSIPSNNQPIIQYKYIMPYPYRRGINGYYNNSGFGFNYGNSPQKVPDNSKFSNPPLNNKSNTATDNSSN